MSSNVSQSGLTEARRKLIINMLAHGQSKRAIGLVVGVHERTNGRWLHRYPSLQEAAAEQQAVNYHRAIERLDEIAFDTKIKPTADTQYKALMRIIDDYEEKQRRKSGEFTADGMNILIMHLGQLLLKFPEARDEFIKITADARSAGLIGDGSSGLASSSSTYD